MEKRMHSVLTNQDIANGVTSAISKYWEQLINLFILPLGYYSAKTLQKIYTHLTLVNVALFVIKCVPTAIYMHKFIRTMYIEAQERLKQKQAEIEDIELQIEIVNTKLCCKDADFVERENKLKRCSEQLQGLRAQVRQIIAQDEQLRQGMKRMPFDVFNLQANKASEEETKLIEELIKEMKYEKVQESMQDNTLSDENFETFGQDHEKHPTNDGDDKDFRIKIVKVTNVFEMACLKHYIKEYKLRRANRRAHLKKQMYKTRKMLNTWNKALSTVLNNNFENSQDPIYKAMGDCNKDCISESFDSGSDYRNSADSLLEDYITECNQNQIFINDNYDDNMSEDMTPMEFNTMKFNNKYNCHKNTNGLGLLPEETPSQMEIEIRANN